MLPSYTVQDMYTTYIFNADHRTYEKQLRIILMTSVARVRVVDARPLLTQLEHGHNPAAVTRW